MSEETKDPEPTPGWEYRTEMGINRRLKEIIQLTEKVTETELAVLRRKLEKLQRGG
jgi:hypothetical protein